MVNWHDPDLLLKDFFAFIRLNHVVVGIYIWEIVTTAGFELDVLRGKRPHLWSIWLYLGTRYTGLLTYIGLLIELDGPRVPCQPVAIATTVMGYACWACASLIVVLRVIAIWDRNIFMSLMAVGVWLCGLALHIRSLTWVVAKYNPIVHACVVLHTGRGLANAIGVITVDMVLLLTMLIGLLRHASRDSTGIWTLLYHQCIIWIALALITETPVLVFLILNLNSVWDGMLLGVALATLSIGAARMYRSLSDWGSFTEYVSTDMPKFTTVITSDLSGVTSQYGEPNVSGLTMEFPSVTRSAGSRTTHESPPLPQADHIQIEFISDGSIPSLVGGNTKDKPSSAGYEGV